MRNGWSEEKWRNFIDWLVDKRVGQDIWDFSKYEEEFDKIYEYWKKDLFKEENDNGFKKGYDYRKNEEEVEFDNEAYEKGYKKGWDDRIIHNHDMYESGHRQGIVDSIYELKEMEEKLYE